MELFVFFDTLCKFVGYGVVGFWLCNAFVDVCVMLGKPVFKMIQNFRTKKVQNSLSNLYGSKLS